MAAATNCSHREIFLLLASLVLSYFESSDNSVLKSREQSSGCSIKGKLIKASSIVASRRENECEIVNFS